VNVPKYVGELHVIIAAASHILRGRLCA